MVNQLLDQIRRRLQVVHQLLDQVRQLLEPVPAEQLRPPEIHQLRVVAFYFQ